jgi:methionyl-tRNA formyltransferase
LTSHPLAVACGQGSLEPIEVQLEGRKRITAEEFANGQRITGHDILGES